MTGTISIRKKSRDNYILNWIRLRTNRHAKAISYLPDQNPRRGCVPIDPGRRRRRHTDSHFSFAHVGGKSRTNRKCFSSPTPYQYYGLRTGNAAHAHQNAMLCILARIWSERRTVLTAFMYAFSIHDPVGRHFFFQRCFSPTHCFGSVAHTQQLTLPLKFCDRAT